MKKFKILELVLPISLLISGCSIDVFDSKKDGLTPETAFGSRQLIETMGNFEVNEVSVQEYYFHDIVAHSTYNAENNTHTLFFDGHDENSSQPIVFRGGISADLTEREINFDNFFAGSLVLVKGYLRKTYESQKNFFEIPYIPSYRSPTLADYYPTILAIQGERYGDGSFHYHTFSNYYSGDDEYHWKWSNCGCELIANKEKHTFGDLEVVSSPTETSSGFGNKICSVCGYELLVSIPPLSDHNGKIEVYSFNDFHGAVLENVSQKRPGLAKFATYLKSVGADENALIIDSGDTFQGSLESNVNRGYLVSKVFDEVGVDVHTLGNHDFDWGQNAIKDLKKSSEMKTNYLASNVYDYNMSTHTQGNTQQRDLGLPFYTKTFSNGIKVGVIGVLGDEEITSICTNLVDNIYFKNHIEVIKKCSDELRQNQECDLVIASVHCGITDEDYGILSSGLTDVSKTTNLPYVDYVVGGHSHQLELERENGIYFTQAGAYGKYVYHATLEVKNGNLYNTTTSLADYTTISKSASTIDPNIESIIDSYEREYSDLSSEVLATNVSGTFVSTEHAANLQAKAIYEEAKRQYGDIDIAVTTNARASLTGSIWTMSDVYESFPFDNVPYVVKVKGESNIKELTYSSNYYYHDANLKTLDKNKWYTVVVLDYQLFHTNYNRAYNYFNHNSSYLEILGELKKGGNSYIYRDVVADYLRTTNQLMKSADFATSLPQFSCLSSI